MIGVVVVDDQALVRAGFKVLVDSSPDLAGASGRPPTGSRRSGSCARPAPDVVLMDIRMPEMDGIEATRQIVGSPDGDSDARVLILTTFDLDEYVYNALRAGASGFLLKDTPPEDLLDAIRVIAGGQRPAGPERHQDAHCRVRLARAAPPAKHADVLRCHHTPRARRSWCSWPAGDPTPRSPTSST